MVDKPNDIEAIYNAALKKQSEKERSDYLDAVCGNNNPVRDRVEALLKAHHEAGDFLEVGDVGLDVTVEGRPVLEGPGTKIGRYKLLELIGQGGMGLVYLAQQQEPVRRQVALKIIKPGMDSRQVIARFEAERQALALLDHSNIARVLDAGTTKTARPYFVMEYVKGISITKYCDRHKLSVEKRLKLFLRVCEAVHHAHQKGIIHRDIKPSNILVFEQDDRAVPKIIDFGIAKAVTQPLTQQTLFTRQGQFLGTPEYMSPEQANMGNEDTDTRADIYSLGVVLYELLAGAPPFDHKVLEKLGFAQFQRILQEEEPPRPSLRFTALGEEAKEIAEKRHTQVVALARRLHRELEWIPLKAMRKDRSRRYRSASELADDIQNYLSGAPLIAGPETAIYRVKKFVRKHAGSVTMVALLTVVIVIGLVASIVMGCRAEHARKKETDARAQAQKQQSIAVEHAEKYRRLWYVHSIALADVAYRDSKIRRVRELLDACPKDLRGWEWYRLNHISDQSLMTLCGHARSALAVRFSPDGKRIISGGKETVRLWDAATGTELLELRAQQGISVDAALSLDGQRLVSAIIGGTVNIWDLDRQDGSVDLAPTITTKIDNPWSCRIPYMKCAALSTDAKYIAASCPDRTIRVWDTATGANLKTLQGHDESATAVAFNSDGSRIVSADDTTIKLWDTATGNELRTLQGHESGVLAVAFSPDGKRIAAACWDATAKLWDISNGTGPQVFKHKELVTSVAFAPDSKRLASGSSDATIKLWDVQSGAELNTLRGHAAGVHSLAFSPDGRRIVSASGDKTIKVWVPDIDNEYMTLQVRDHEVDYIEFSPDGKRIVSSSKHEGIKAWDPATGAELMEIRGLKSAGTVIYSPDGERIIAADGNDIKVCDASNGKELMSLSGHKGAICSMSYNPDGTTIVSGSQDSMIKIWDVAAGAELMNLGGHTSRIRAVAFSPDGKTIVSGSENGTIKMWDTGSGAEVMTLHENEATEDTAGFRRVHAVTFSPNGKHIASASFIGRGNTIRIWDATSGVEVKSLRGHRRVVTSLTFSPNGKRIVSGGAFGTIKLWDFATGTEVMTLRHHERGYVGCIKFSPDGQTIATCGGGSTIKLWKSGPRNAIGVSE
ncbi:MAG: protein kinase domain-containing protein [Planctomycetota bacterium]|jgi:WD40 repeat protein